MNIKDALNLLNLSQGCITLADIKAVYRKSISLYHPDRNLAGLEITQLFNKAYEVAQNYEREYTKANTSKNYG